MAGRHDINVRDLSAADAIDLSSLLGAASKKYVAEFFPFSFESDQIRSLLQAAELDRYWGIDVDRRLVGFFMLRGFDSGYSRPTFGVFVEQCWNRRGLATLALSYALAWCRCNHIHAVMLKVASGNRGAVQVYERAGFVSTDICDPTGHKVYEWHAHQRKDLNRGVDADD